ncbi:MAG: TIGR03757 family integrating conjugative element protein [Proteobacteria bacterium]|nr:TIGR03757 family integrating conjugative element protein [Pseudomonadota bacterium]
MTNNTAAIHTGTVFTLLFILCQLTWAEKQMVMTPTSIEIFTTTDQRITAIDRFAVEHMDIAIQIYKLDAIKGLEDTLSEGLSADPDKAKRLVLARLQQLNKGTRSQLEHSATALAKAVQYGVEKYPAIVFDGELVVYGLTDLSVAVMHYRLWRSGETS